MRSGSPSGSWGFTSSLADIGGSLGVKTNAMGFDVRNLIQDLVLRFGVYHAVGSWGWNLALYSPMGGVI